MPNFFDNCHHTAHNISYHTHTICKRAELMSKTQKNDLFKKKNPYKSPKIRIFEKICTKMDFLKKSVLVRTNPYEWEHCAKVGLFQQKKKKTSNTILAHTYIYTGRQILVNLLSHTEKRYLWLAAVDLHNCLSIVYVYSKVTGQPVYTPFLCRKLGNGLTNFYQNFACTTSNILPQHSKI